jgi:hypothetical protein
MRSSASFSRRVFSYMFVSLLVAWSTCGTARAAVTQSGAVQPDPVNPSLV